ncbi:MAG: sulfurtransferase [Caulobacterales bacterium 32-69-10]|nr:MAG: sulfurtransferase [Caulobacterales bacterium 32-69-10]
MFGAPKTKDLTPQQVQAALDAHQILLIDVREPAEFAAERIHGALNFPLSTFDPGALPQAGDRLVVFQCGSGKRSAAAVDQCRKAGHAIDAHLAGGIAAWKAQGLPTVALDSATGAVRDRT